MHGCTVSPASAACFRSRLPKGSTTGAFHTDVLAVGNESFLMLHEKAFVKHEALLEKLRTLLGGGFTWMLATEKELPAKDAVSAYPFNSQIVTLPDRSMAIIAPVESRESSRPRDFLEKVLAGDNPVKAVHYLDVRQSMNNGGGPACLRFRVPLTDEEKSAIKANVFYSKTLHETLAIWVKKHYRDRLTAKDLEDPKLAQESMTALDELTRILNLGSVYDFQRTPR